MSAACLSLSGPCGQGRRGRQLLPLSPPATMPVCLHLVPGQYRVCGLLDALLWTQYTRHRRIFRQLLDALIRRKLPVGPDARGADAPVDL